MSLFLNIFIHEDVTHVHVSTVVEYSVVIVSFVLMNSVALCLIQCRQRGVADGCEISTGVQTGTRQQQRPSIAVARVGRLCLLYKFKSPGGDPTQESVQMCLAHLLNTNPHPSPDFFTALQSLPVLLIEQAVILPKV